MEASAFDFSYMFYYSERPKTLAERKYKDDVPEETKKRRLSEVIALQNRLSLESNRRDIGKEFEVLVEGISKRSSEKVYGRNSQNKVVVFNNPGIPAGTYVRVKINDCTSATLIGEVAGEIR
jgi:tRNA-2-methylthio-N6-dimethylallyladenosine synthase